ncbi:shTK domain protein [Ancylostoma duodenale]|uniref:ShTK domain protein n=1 Tax=Ancylostoma duodenale TaxID=51022 RepID=A0A0C2DXT1_9BILA|nr:shTK domain protein [Ancylostoma duodenale]
MTYFSIVALIADFTFWCTLHTTWFVKQRRVSLIRKRKTSNFTVVSTRQIVRCGKGAKINCCDKHESCGFWARNDECKKNPEWMQANCQLSCRVCNTDSNKPSTQKSQCGVGKESNCCDKDPSCALWASQGECSKNPEWMLSNCQLSCHNCKTDSNKPETRKSR